MKGWKMGKGLQALVFGLSIVFLTATASLGAVEFDAVAFEAEIVAAIADGQGLDSAVAKAIDATLLKYPEFPGGQQALRDIMEQALAGMTIDGINNNKVLAAAEKAFADINTPGYKGRTNAQQRGGNAYGPTGKPDPASKT
jgi:hypothetical protein